jgi:hypothetical protein
MQSPAIVQLLRACRMPAKPTADKMGGGQILRRLSFMMKNRGPTFIIPAEVFAGPEQTVCMVHDIRYRLNRPGLFRILDKTI